MPRPRPLARKRKGEMSDLRETVGGEVQPAGHGGGDTVAPGPTHAPDHRAAGTNLAQGAVSDLDSAPEAATATAAMADAAVAPATAASLREYMRAYVVRLRSGDSGVLPVVVGLVVLAVVFQSLNSNFLTAGNLVNLMVQGAVYMLLAMGTVFVLLLGEIDLSVGFLSGVGGVVAAEFVSSAHNKPWWLAILAGVAATGLIGLVQGLLISLIRLPSFIVTLAGFLAINGVMLWILGNGGTLPINDNTINNLANGNLTPTAGWVVMSALVAVYAALTITRASRRRNGGLASAPMGLVVLKVLGVAVAAVVVVLLSNANRGALVSIEGMPWVLLIVLGSLLVWAFLLTHTRFGRYVYAVGGSAEAARRAGISLVRVRALVFTISGLTAGVAGIIYASRLRSVSTNINGGQLVLYAIAAAVIGGTSLFGGRGKAIHAVLGGLVIAAIDNGMGLLGMSAASKYVVTGVVLLAAVTVDAVARRSRAASGVV
jgi:D-xylose transport system permease protein